MTWSQGVTFLTLNIEPWVVKLMPGSFSTDDFSSALTTLTTRWILTFSNKDLICLWSWRQYVYVHARTKMVDRNTRPYNRHVCPRPVWICSHGLRPTFFFIPKSKDWGFQTHRLCLFFQFMKECSFAGKSFVLPEKNVCISHFRKGYDSLCEKRPVYLQFCVKKCPWSDSL